MKAGVPSKLTNRALWFGCLLLGWMLGCSEAEIESPSEPASPGQEVEAAEVDTSEQAPALDDDATEPGAEPDNEEAVDDDDDRPLEGFGDISGACGLIDDELREQAEPAFIENSIDFDDDPYDADDFMALTEGGQEIMTDGNAGGSSLLSEVFAYEVLFRCEAALLLKTETEIIYEDSQGKMTDLLIEMEGHQLGVSVTRAVGFPREDPYTVERAQDLLEQKLSGVIASSANVSAADGWAKQILYVMAYAPEHAESLAEAFALISDELKSNTIVYVTVSDGDDAFLY